MTLLKHESRIEKAGLDRATMILCALILSTVPWASYIMARGVLRLFGLSMTEVNGSSSEDGDTPR